VEAKDKKIKELEKEIVQLKSPDYPKSEEGLTLHFDDGKAMIIEEKCLEIIQQENLMNRKMNLRNNYLLHIIRNNA